MRYVKKPIPIDAFQYGIETPAQWFTEHPDYLGNVKEGGLEKARIKTMEGEYLVAPGNYVLKGVQGEIYPCDEKVFRESYEIFEDLTPQEMVKRSNDKIMKTCRETRPFVYCFANEVSQSITELIMAAHQFDKDQHPGNRKRLIEKMRGILDYEENFVNSVRAVSHDHNKA